MNYKVKKGDTLSKIAKVHNMSLSELMKINGISKEQADKLQIGQSLKIKSQPTLQPKNYLTSSTAIFPRTVWPNTSPTGKTPIPYKDIAAEQQYLRDNAKAIQEQLIEAKFNVGKWGADGIWGKASQTALEEAKANGYRLVKGKLVKPESPKALTKNDSKFLEYKNVPEQLIKANAQSSNSDSFGTRINRYLNSLSESRKQRNNIINTLAVASGNEVVRNIAAGINYISGGFMDAFRARTNSYLEEKFPGWIEEKNKEAIGKGKPVWTIDKEFNIARYYDKDGNLLISSPAGTGLVSGQKYHEGDNKTPEGTFILGNPELGESKKGGKMSFGTYFYRTNHKNKNGQFSGVGLHGTGFPIANGSNISHGCIRIDNDDIEKFHSIAPNRGAGTAIIISDKQS